MFVLLHCNGVTWIPCFIRCAGKGKRKRKRFMNKYDKAVRFLNKYGEEEFTKWHSS